MLINQDLLDTLSAQAKTSPRLRMSFDLRDSVEDGSQRILNALEPGTILPIHRHRYSSETVAMLRGKAKWIYYDDEGNVIDTVIVEAGGNICGISVPKGQWHNTVCLETGTVIMEAKDGPYAPLRDEDIMCIKN